MASPEEIKRWQRLVGASPDGNPGRMTFEATVAWFAGRGLLVRDAPAPSVVLASDLPAEPRARVVAIALGELGPGGATKDQDPQKYIRDAAPIYIGQPPNAKAWCGIFWLWCLRQAGLTTATWRDGVGFAGDYPRVSLPEPGDGMYFGKPNHHYGVVIRVANGRVYTVEGNTLTAPREGVTYTSHPLNAVDAGGGCYFSIRNLLR